MSDTVNSLLDHLRAATEARPTEEQSREPDFKSVVCSELCYELPAMEELSQYCITVSPTSILGEGKAAGFAFVTPPDVTIPRAQILKLTEELCQLVEYEQSARELYFAAGALQRLQELTQIASCSWKHAFTVSKLGTMAAVLNCAKRAVEVPELQDSCRDFLQALCVSTLFGLEALRQDAVSLELLEDMLGGAWCARFNDTCRLCLARYHEYTMDFVFKTHDTKQLKK